VRRYRFLDEALVEYEDAVEYYERAQSGLGDTFTREVERVLELTLEFPDMGSPVVDTPADLHVRRRLVRRFDVEIDYVALGDELVVLAIFHSKRRPGYWRARLERFRR
jgi:plasmid stabilization system protein ParE